MVKLRPKEYLFFLNCIFCDDFHGFTRTIAVLSNFICKFHHPFYKLYKFYHAYLLAPLADRIIHKIGAAPSFLVNFGRHLFIVLRYSVE